MTNHRIWHKITARALRQVGMGLLAASLAFSPALGQSSLLPDGKQQFLSNTGVPLASGKVFMYVPNTTTFKNTWQDAAQVTLNTNPIILDSSGRALIYGSGVYRQLVQTSAGVTIYDALTTSTLTQTDVGYFIGNATSTGSANAQAVATTTPSTFALTTGFTLTFKPGFTNTGAMTLNVSGTGIKPVVKPAYTGQAVLTGGEVVANSMTAVVYDGANYMLQSMPDGFGVSTNITSATTTDLGTIASHDVNITGTTTITSFGSTASLNYPFYMLRFSGALTITHNGSSLILPGSANITTAAFDTAIAQYLGSGNWQVVQYTKVAVPPYPGLSIAFTKQYLISGTTYNTPAGARTIVVRGCGGGGGGGAVATNPGAAGGTTTFNSINANGGSGGSQANGAGGLGGTGGTGSANLRLNGAPGEHGSGSGVGGRGASGFLGVGGGLPGSGAAAGSAAQANSCAGGGGGANAAASNGAGGGAGEYMEIVISSPAVSYTYAIGALGAGGTAGTQAGGNGGSGILLVEEYYKFLRSVCGEPANDNYDFEMCKAA